MDFDEGPPPLSSPKESKKARKSPLLLPCAVEDADGGEPNKPAAASILKEKIPDLAHEAIASFLTNNDLYSFMTTSQWFCQHYGALVKRVKFGRPACCPSLGPQEAMTEAAIAGANVTALLDRRPSADHLQVKDRTATMGLAGAMAARRCEKVRTLEFDYPIQETDPSFASYLTLLATGFCSQLTNLSLRYNPVGRSGGTMGLAAALRSWTNKGTRHSLKSLEFKLPGDDTSSLPLPHRHDLKGVLNSGACEELEVLGLEGCRLEGSDEDAIIDWLTRTGAPHLQAIEGQVGPRVLSTLIMSPRKVAPNLQVLDLSMASDRNHVMYYRVIEGIDRGAWPNLRGITVSPPPGGAARLMEVLTYRYPRLTSLRLDTDGSTSSDSSPSFRYESADLSVAKVLRDGAFPLLEELGLMGHDITQQGMGQLATVLGGRPTPRLIKLDLSFCPEGCAVVLFEAMANCEQHGGWRKLECLNVRYNDLQDDGVCRLAEAIQAGALPGLKELNLESVGLGRGGGEIAAGVVALAQALSAKKCPSLQALYLRRNEADTNHIGPVGYHRLQKALDSIRGPGKVRLHREWTGMGLDPNDPDF